MAFNAVNTILALLTLLVSYSLVDAAALSTSLDLPNSALQPRETNTTLNKTDGDLTVPRPVNIYFPEGELNLLIAPQRTQSAPMRPQQDVGFLIRRFNNWVEREIIREGADTAVTWMVEDIDYNLLTINVRMPGEHATRAATWRNMRGLGTILLLHIHEVNDWPSCFYLSDATEPRSLDNNLGFGYIGPRGRSSCSRQTTPSSEGHITTET